MRPPPLQLPPQLPVKPPVPSVIPAWKGKQALREAGLLGKVEAAVQAAGGRVRDAWDGAAEWDRGSESLADLAAALGCALNKSIRCLAMLP